MIDYKLKLSQGDISVVSVTVHPQADGTDATARIQSAIDECAANGGGTVYLSAGRYVLKTPLTVRRAVVLRGENDPTVEKDAAKNTVLEAYHGENNPDGEPQIIMRECSGLKDVVIVYPKQTIADAVPYSPAIRQHGVDSMTVENVVLVNPWRGIQCGPDANELHFIKNVEMTALDVGIYIDMTTDIGRIQGFTVNPECYAEYFGVPVSEVRAYTLAHTTAVFMARSDWEYSYDIAAAYCKVGVKITAVKDSGPNAQISGVKLENCDIGFEIIDVNPYGIALSDSVIAADIGGLTAAVVVRDSFRTAVQMNGVDFRGTGGYKTFLDHDGQGFLSFVDCTFVGQAETVADIRNGGAAFIRCAFDVCGTDLRFSDRVTCAQVLGCTSGGENKTAVKIENNASADTFELIYSAERKNYPKASRGGFKNYPYNANPAKELLFNVEDYGAKRSFTEELPPDSTEAIRAAISAAKEAGGGIVYLPGGRYFVEGTLNIPTGVELRGVAEVPMHTMGGGSVLITNHGKGDENAEPFVTLEEKAGVRGVLFYNLDQNSEEPVEYPYAVQSRGKYCYVIHAVFVNMWRSLDMATYPSEGHYVSYIAGAPFRMGVYLGSNAGEGWVENIQFNPHYWFRSNLPNHPNERTWHTFWHHQMKNLEALKFGYNEKEHLLGTFVFAAKHGLSFEKQDGRGTNGKFLGHGTDSGLVALYLGGGGEVELINTQLVNIEAEGRRSYIYAEPDAGKYRIYNTLMWGDPHYAAIFDGGDIFIEQLNLVAPGKEAVVVNGGEIELASVFFQRTPARCDLAGGKTVFYAPMTTEKGSGRQSYDIRIADAADVTVDFAGVKN